MLPVEITRKREGVEPEEFEFNRVVFRVNSSPFQAQFVAQVNTKKHKDELPMAAETVLKSTYMDDSMDSVADDNQAWELYSQLDKFGQEQGCELESGCQIHVSFSKRFQLWIEPLNSILTVVEY